MGMERRFFTRHAVTVLILIVILWLIPFPTTIVPEWKIRIVNREGKPLADKRVTQSWRHYSLQFCCGNEDDRATDENGYVTFPKRVIWASLLRRVTFTVWAHIMTLAHGSTGIHAWVTAYPETVFYEPDKPLPSEIVLAGP